VTGSNGDDAQAGVELALQDPLDLGHLHPSAQLLARLPDAERLRHVRADRWIGYSRATAALNRLETLYGRPSKQRMPNLLLIGPTSNGKSMIIEKFRRAHPPITHPDREQIPVLAVQMPSEPSVTRFYVALLVAMGAPMRPRLAGRGDVRREFLNLIRFLGNELRIPWSGSAPGRRTWPSAPTTNWRTGSSRSPCPGGNRTTKHVPRWPVSPPPSRYGAAPTSPLRR
jgi:hypothetical protein